MLLGATAGGPRRQPSMDGQRGMAAWRGEYEAAGPGPGQVPEWAGLSNDQEALLAALQARCSLLSAPTAQSCCPGRNMLRPNEVGNELGWLLNFLHRSSPWESPALGKSRNHHCLLRS